MERDILNWTKPIIFQNFKIFRIFDKQKDKVHRKKYLDTYDMYIQSIISFAVENYIKGLLLFKKNASNIELI